MPNDTDWMHTTDERFLANLAAFDARTEQRRRVMRMLDDMFNTGARVSTTGGGDAVVPHSTILD